MMNLKNLTLFGLTALFIVSTLVFVKKSGRWPSDATSPLPMQDSASTFDPIELPMDNSNMLTIGDTHYLFDVVDNGPEELLRLLNRAEELAHHAKGQAQNVSIAMVIHGPDLEIFENRNYHKYKSLVDTAARLDAFGVIDFKLCQTLAFNGGLQIDDFPPFMEFVPFGPDEISRLRTRGYVDF